MEGVLGEGREERVINGREGKERGLREGEIREGERQNDKYTGRD